jgi:hypothetical protein
MKKWGWSPDWHGCRREGKEGKVRRGNDDFSFGMFLLQRGAEKWRGSCKAMWGSRAVYEEGRKKHVCIQIDYKCMYVGE